jgi:hypothetical protein
MKQPITVKYVISQSLFFLYMLLMTPIFLAIFLIALFGHQCCKLNEIVKRLLNIQG